MTTATRSARNAAPLPRIERDDHLPPVRVANALAAGANAGHWTIPDELALAVRRLATIDAAWTIAQQDARELELVAASARTAALAAASASAEAGEDPGAIEAPIAEAAAMLPRIALRADLLREARARAGERLGELVGDAGVNVYDRLEAALAETLTAAAPDAPVVLDGLHTWTDPAAVHRAPQPVQEAFGRLLELTRRHDAIRAAAVTAWQLYRRDDAAAERIRGFGQAVPSNATAGEARQADEAGGGVILRTSESTEQLVAVDYRPAGHPVQRLALAATPREA